MSVYELKDNRMLCWDEFLIDKIDSAEVKMHHPTKRNQILNCDMDWEGNHCGYARYLKVGDKYRFYYGCKNYVFRPEKTDVSSNKRCFAVCESDDGINFKRMPINKHEYDGVTHNNIFLLEDRDNFSVFYDENPNCPANEKFKALSMGSPSEQWGHGLYLYASEDGIDFTAKCKLPLPGSFDSYNIMLWDKETERYYFFYRGERRTDGGDIDFDVVKKERTIFREVRVSTSKDLVNFEHFGELDYGDDNIPMQFYTNNIVKYYRAKDMFIGMPMRYNDRFEEEENYKQMPLAERHAYMTKAWGREGTALSDVALITSRDGYHFNKWDEAFMTQGIEARNNWWYGGADFMYGMYETPSDTEGAPNEISFIYKDNYRIKAVEFWRYTIRLDGFFSWYAKFRGGEILTKPFTFEGNELEINFSSSAFGDITVTVCDEEGNELEGYKSIRIFGDSVCRKVKFEKELKELEGKPVRLKFFLKDAHLYSFKFN